MSQQPVLPDALSAPLSPNVELLLGSRIPARLAWTHGSVQPRVLPIWFHWNGETLAMATFEGAAKLRDIQDGTVVAVSIDTDTFPYRSLKLRGPVSLQQTDDLADAYREAAIRYLGPETGPRWCEALAGRAQVLLTLTPTWAVESDMSGMPFMAADR